MNPSIRNKLIAALVAMSAAGGAYVTVGDTKQPVAPEIMLAMELGSFYESSGRHIGVPYVDKIGKGQPLTVCNGVTGPQVVAGKYYTKEDCQRLELPIYTAKAKEAQAMFRHWDTYNVWVRASLIDMIYNLGATAVKQSTLTAKANAGDLIGACKQMGRWVRGTVNGKSVVLHGLVDRRETTEELCAQWGRDGHFSAGLVK